jgi:hypothetical protein
MLPAVTSRRRFLQTVGGAAAGLALGSPAFAKDAKALPKPQNELPPDAALDRLMKGNVRYVDGVSRRHDFKAEREALVGGQNPYPESSVAPTRASPPNTLSIAAEAICSSVGSLVISPTMTASQAWNTPLLSSTRRCCSCWDTKAAAR